MPELKGLTNYNSDDNYGGRPRCYGHHTHLTAREVTDPRLEDTWKDHPPDTLVSVSPPVDSRRHGTFPAGRSVSSFHPATNQQDLATATAIDGLEGFLRQPPVASNPAGGRFSDSMISRTPDNASVIRSKPTLYSGIAKEADVLRFGGVQAAAQGKSLPLSRRPLGYPGLR